MQNAKLEQQTYSHYFNDKMAENTNFHITTSLQDQGHEKVVY
jgi:hypothetical protein